jgi:hypothetical protein
MITIIITIMIMMIIYIYYIFIYIEKLLTFRTIFSFQLILFYSLPFYFKQIALEIEKLHSEHDNGFSSKTEECKAKVAELLVPEPPFEKRKSLVAAMHSMSYESLYYDTMSPSPSSSSNLNLNLIGIPRVFFLFFFFLSFF